MNILLVLVTQLPSALIQGCRHGLSAMRRQGSTLAHIVILKKSHTSGTKWQLEHEGNPGQQPSAKPLGKHRPLEVSRSSATCIHALTVGYVRRTGWADLARDLGFTLT